MTGSLHHSLELLLKSSKPGIWESIARTISRPPRRIDFAVRFHHRIMVAGFPAALSQITNELLARLELGARGLAAIEITHQADAEGNVVQVVTVHVATVYLTPPAIPYFDRAVPRRCPVPDNELIGQPILHVPHMPVVIIEYARISLPRAAVMDNDELPASLRHRRTINFAAHRTGQIAVARSAPAAAPAASVEKAIPKTGLIFAGLFNRELRRFLGSRVSTR